MGITKRRLYKPERRSARTKSGLAFEKWAPISCPDASGTEIARAINAFCKQLGARVGQCIDYDPYKDRYTIVAEYIDSARKQDCTVAGEEVGAAIRLARIMAGEKMHRPWERNRTLPGLPGATRTQGAK